MDGGNLNADRAQASIVDLSAAAETGAYSWIKQGFEHEKVDEILTSHGLKRS
jgi:hypothetical protein